ncbi:MAG: flagellar basal body P-ring formation protein FlgA [Gammaproteobacteria bacterium]|nr:flagellar basal body P-ring formation protein FlgA [Gammaproteobacteria bacterium]
MSGDVVGSEQTPAKRVHMQVKAGKIAQPASADNVVGRRESDVGLLTIASPLRHFSDSRVTRPCFRRRMRRWMPILLLSVFCSPVMAQTVAMLWQSTDEISRVAEDFLRDRVARGDQRVEPQAGKLDARLQLPKCSEALQPFLRRGTEIRRRTIVGVRCNGQRPWKMYVPVDVVVTGTVLVASQMLPKGHVLTDGDFTVAERDISRLQGGYMTDAAQLRGQRLKQPLPGGRVITPSVLQADPIVRRGQTVTLLVQQGSLSIRMSGTALMDGVRNQRIRVENHNSRRVVEGLVRSRELVEVLIN